MSKLSRRLSRSRASGELIHFPSGVMPMGMTSYFFLSSASMMDAAETRETSCSADLPPKTTPTLSLEAMDSQEGYEMWDVRCGVHGSSFRIQVSCFWFRFKFQDSGFRFAV